MKRWITLFLTLLLLTGAWAQKRDDRYLSYIEQYAPMAMSEMKRASVPASITLAQGLLESAAGNSTLAREGRNHFGIKCGGKWDGPSMLRDDDAPDECFRVYGDVAESYADHSRFLHGRRYQPLFELEITDYAGWARGLSACGYATDPNYADRLITIIERYSLYRYDSDDGHVDDLADFIVGALQQRHHMRRSRGLHYVVAAPGDTYAAIADEFGLSTTDLLIYNDADHDGEIKAWEEVYLQPKHDTAPKGMTRATIGDGESFHSLAQRFGMSLTTLRRLNPKAPDAPGTRLRLR